VKIREWIGPGQFISFIKNRDFVIWKQGERDIEFSRPDPNLVTGTSDGRRVVTPPPPLGPVRKPLPYSPLRQNPTDIRRQDTTIYNAPRVGASAETSVGSMNWKNTRRRTSLQPPPSNCLRRGKNGFYSNR
jgi:hypothetical protein